MFNVNFNDEKNGIELSFDSKPNNETLAAIKEAGFRWSNRGKFWYAKDTAERRAFVETLSTDKTEKVVTKSIIDLWNLTRTDSIENNYEIHRLYDTKEIAANIRKHLRNRFPFCKWSVRSEHGSIYVGLKSSGWAEESEEVKAIVKYAKVYADSWNYDNSDLMTDYFDYNFYLSCRVEYDYTQTETTVAEMNISELFEKNKSEFEKAERIREEEEFKKRLEEDAKRKAEYEKAEKIRLANIKKVEESVEVKEVNYFEMDLISPQVNKNNSIDECMRMVEEHGSGSINARVTKEVHMSKEIYDLFKENLLSDWSFIEGTGGSETDDYRINSFEDFCNMTKSEAETVDSYSTACVAIICDNELMCVVDAQGYSYCRYTFLVGSDTHRLETYSSKQVITEEQRDAFRVKAETIEDVSADIITRNGWERTWNTDNQLEYISEMKSWLTDNNFDLTKDIIRQITIVDLKVMMYRIFREMSHIVEQIKRANLKQGQKITMVHINGMGGLSVDKVTFEEAEYGSYAQYDKAVKLVFKPEGRRKLYYNWYYGEMIMVDGWVDFPESLFWEIKETKNGFITRKSKYLSCDRTMYKVAQEYLDSKNIKCYVKVVE